METNEKVYVSTQLLAVLPPMVLKILLFNVNWQNSPKGIMLYEHRFGRTLKMTDQEVRVSIQTLINLKLIDLTRIDGKWRIELNQTEFKKYYKIPMERVIEHEGYKLADKITYDEVEKEDDGDMSEEQIQKMILRLQAQLNEKKQTKQLVASVAETDDLPF
jgi:hypothetical protein